MNSATLYKLLSRRKIKKNKSMGYYLVMKEIAGRSNIEMRHCIIL